MNPKTYRVKCKVCGQHDDIVIDDNHNIYWKPVNYIISGRYRLDMNFGWQCKCGNNDLVTKQEKRDIRNLQAPDPKDISKVLKAIQTDKPKFKMESA